MPVDDHQNSTRLVLGAYDRSIRQSLDYAQFGRVSAIRDAAGTLVVDSQGAPNLSALLTVSAHHGSLIDVQTGLQNKGRRWYSPDLGRFVSEDPIQDGSNWYAFAGNNPVTYADPTGLYQQGHPLQGGSRQLDSFLRNSVNTAVARPAISPTTTFGGFVGAPSAAATHTPARPNSVLGTVRILGDLAVSAIRQTTPLASAGINSAARLGVATLGAAPPASNKELFPPQPGGDPLLYRIPVVGAITKYFTSYYDANDRARELNRQSQADDPNRTLRAGDIGTIAGGSQFRNSASAATQSRQIVRNTAVDAGIEIATAGAGGLFGKVDDVNDLRKAGRAAQNATPKSFNSFSALKRSLGPAGEGKAYHHIVEQRAINVTRFGAEVIHSTTNVVAVPRQVNQQIANYYSRNRPFTDGQTVRQWLNSQSYAKQSAFGQRILNVVQSGGTLP